MFTDISENLYFAKDGCWTSLSILIFKNSYFQKFTASVNMATVKNNMVSKKVLITREDKRDKSTNY